MLDVQGVHEQCPGSPWTMFRVPKKNVQVSCEKSRVSRDKVQDVQGQCPGCSGTMSRVSRENVQGVQGQSPARVSWGQCPGCPGKRPRSPGCRGRKSSYGQKIHWIKIQGDWTGQCPCSQSWTHWTSVADPEGVRGWANPTVSTNYFIFMWNFEKKWVN